MIGPQPLPRGDEAGERLRELGEYRLARRRRQIVARQQVFADRRQMAETLDNAVERERRDVGVGIFQKREASFAPQPTSAIAAATERGSRTRPAIAACDSGMAGGDQVDQIVVAQQRRMRSIGIAISGWSAASACTTTCGAFCAEANTSRQRAPHQWRRIVEQHDHRAFGGGEIVGRKIGMEIGARQRDVASARSPGGAWRTHCKN